VTAFAVALFAQLALSENAVSTAAESTRTPEPPRRPTASAPT